jgi:hypothetical protein
MPDYTCVATSLYLLLTCYILQRFHHVGCLASDETLIDDFEGSCRGVIEALSRLFPGGTEEHHGKPQDRRCPS